MDPLAEEYVDYTLYQFASNQVIHAPEIEGLENADDLNKKRNPHSISHKILKGGMTGALPISQSDSPAPGPGDAVGVVAAGTLLTAGVVYFYELATDDNSVSSNNTSNASEANKKGDYSHLKEPKHVRDGGKTTAAQRNRILEENIRSRIMES